MILPVSTKARCSFWFFRTADSARWSSRRASSPPYEGPEQDGGVRIHTIINDQRLIARHMDYGFKGEAVPCLIQKGAGPGCLHRPDRRGAYPGLRTRGRTVPCQGCHRPGRTVRCQGHHRPGQTEAYRGCHTHRCLKAACARHRRTDLRANTLLAEEQLKGRLTSMQHQDLPVADSSLCRPP